MSFTEPLLKIGFMDLLGMFQVFEKELNCLISCNFTLFHRKRDESSDPILISSLRPVGIESDSNRIFQFFRSIQRNIQSDIQACLTFSSTFAV